MNGCSRLGTPAGLPPRSTAPVTLDVSPRSLRRWQAPRRRGESLGPKPIPGRPRPLSPADETRLIDQVTAAPDATLTEHRDRCRAEPGRSVSVSTIGRIIRRHDLPLKKRR